MFRQGRSVDNKAYKSHVGGFGLAIKDEIGAFTTRAPVIRGCGRDTGVLRVRVRVRENEGVRLGLGLEG
jgi:hypothetical protein